MTTIETIKETFNETLNETTQIEPFNSTKQERPKKYIDTAQAMIAVREQRKNARIR
ncbi:MAG: hypothetical protein EZS28_031096, partial [Streblomastix strix]